MSVNNNEGETKKATSENEVLVLKNQRLECLLKINDIETEIAKLEKQDQTSMQNQNKVLTAKNDRFELLLKTKQLEIEIKNFALKTATKAAATAIREQEKIAETTTTNNSTPSRKASPTHHSKTKSKPSPLARNKAPQQSLSAMFFSFETKLTSGFAKFVENKPVPSIGDYDVENTNINSDQLFDLYETYQEWYEDICNLTKPMNSNMVIDFPGHLFVKWKLSPKKGIIFSSQETEGDSQSYIEVGTLAAGWTHENTRLVTVLHPTQNNKIVELFPMGKSKEWHIWKNIEKVAEYQNCDGYVICCCRRRETTRTVHVTET